MINVIHLTKDYLNFKILRKCHPINLVLFLTYMCNSRCSTCFVWKYYKRYPTRLKLEMGKKIFFNLFDELKHDLSWLVFTGGEPFLREDIVEIITYAYNHTSILTGAINTNGLDTNNVVEKTREILESIPKRKELNLGVSLDGRPDLYMEIRGLDGFKKTISTFLKLKDLKKEFQNFQLCICYTFSHFNTGSFRKFYEFLNKKYGITINEFTFTLGHRALALRHGGGITQKQNKMIIIDGISPQSKEDIMKDIRFILNKLKNCKSSIRHKFYKYYLENIPKFLDHPGNQIIPCSACKLFAAITPDGWIYPCTIWREKIGNLKRKSFYEIWNSAKVKNIREMIKEQKCPNCWITCTAQVNFFGNIEKILL